MAFRRVHTLAAAAASALLTTVTLLAEVPTAGTTAPAATDVLFVFDTTGSMIGALDEAKSQAADVMASLEGRLPNLRFGLAQIKDYGDDPVWRVEQPLTTDRLAVQAALAPLTADGGGDLPEAYGTALHETMHDAAVGWSVDAKRLVVLVADDVPHDDDLNAGVPAEIVNRPSPWNTGVDPGPTGAGIDWQRQLDEFKRGGYTLAFVLYHGVLSYLPYWNWWAGLTGGKATESTSSTALGDVLVEIIAATASVCQSAGDEEPPQCDADEAPAFSADAPVLPADPAPVDSSDPDAPNDGSVPGSCPPPVPVSGTPTSSAQGAPEPAESTSTLPGDPWNCPDVTGNPASIPAVTWSQNATAIRFRNADGVWTIYKRCLDATSGGRRFTVGPGYLARLERAGVAIVDDYRGRSDTWTPGFINAVNGGLGTFGWHHARGQVEATPAGDDPTTSVVEIGVGRTPQVIEGRMCAPANGGYGVYARNWFGPTRVSPSRVDYTMDVWLRDQYGNTGAGPGGHAIARVRYRYTVWRSSISLWALVTTYAKTNEGGTPFVKEPKFTALVRGGGYVRMAVFEGPDGRVFAKAVLDGQPDGTAVLTTDHSAADGRIRVRWDFEADRNSEGSPGCSAATPCLNVVGRSFPVRPAPVGIARTDQARNWEGAALGLDRWAVESAARAKAYPRDTRGDGVVSSCKVPLPKGKKLSEADLSRLSELASPSMDAVREWELGGWKSGGDTKPYQAALTIFPGWENGRGGWDCEPLQRAFAAREESWGSYFSFSLNDGWKLSG
ncbi:MAG TPA: VWA domain-containing protein [Gaiellaceae bacterium]|nr:VWA domain-containing protein [Gaiellaceae bacterium]